MKNTKSLVLASLFAAFIALCAFIQVPSVVPFTLQIMAVFIISGLFKPKTAFLAVLIYLCIGAVGLPVFAGFKGGLGALFGTSGGYLISFLVIPIIMGIFDLTIKHRTLSLILGMTTSLFIIYIFGTLWYTFVYALEGKLNVTFYSAFSVCVLPFLIPDIIKIVLSFAVITKLRGKFNKI